MAEKTGIAWTDSTFNPWIGCTKVSPGCDNCDAAVSTPARSMRIVWGADQPHHRTSTQNWKTPVSWNGQHEAFKATHGRRRRVFCASLAGCATVEPYIAKLQSKLENNISCSTDGTKAFMNSMWIFFGITSKVSDGDTKAICNLPAPSTTVAPK